MNAHENEKKRNYKPKMSFKKVKIRQNWLLILTLDPCDTTTAA